MDVFFEIIYGLQTILLVGGIGCLMIGAAGIRFSSSSDFSQEGERQGAHKLKAEVREARGLDLTADNDMQKLDDAASDWGERFLLYGGAALGVAFVLGPGEFMARISSLFTFFF